jgi:hypothetical protein
VPSVSTQSVTPRTFGLAACRFAIACAEPGGPSVWWTMMFFQAPASDRRAATGN